MNNKNDGKWSYYYASGELESEGYFKDDVVEGKWTWYYPNGKKWNKEYFLMENEKVYGKYLTRTVH
jgi:uncharacterized protein